MCLHTTSVFLDNQNLQFVRHWLQFSHLHLLVSIATPVEMWLPVKNLNDTPWREQLTATTWQVVKTTKVPSYFPKSPSSVATPLCLRQEPIKASRYRNYMCSRQPQRHLDGRWNKWIMTDLVWFGGDCPLTRWSLSFLEKQGQSDTLDGH